MEEVIIIYSEKIMVKYMVNVGKNVFCKPRDWPFLPNIKQTLKISILVLSKYKTNKDFIKIEVYFNNTISSFSTKISYKQCC